MAGESNTHEVRLGRVEREVQTIREEMGGVKNELTRVTSDIRGLGGILSRIEQSVNRDQERQDQREERSRPSMIAVATVLITIISILVGGAWTISGQLATTSTRLDDEDRQLVRLMGMRDRELDNIENGSIVRKEVAMAKTATTKAIARARRLCEKYDVDKVHPNEYLEPVKDDWSDLLNQIK